MQVYLDQVGCRLNYAEMETLAGHLRSAGHLVVSAPEAAQVIVLNTCAVTTQAGRKSRQRVHQLHRSNPDARIALTGCWATLRPSQAANLDGVALVAANQQKELLHLLLEPWSAELDDPALLARMQPDGGPFPTSPDACEDVSRRQRTRAFVKAQDGCNNRCTFCVVTQVRGDSRSRTVGDIVAEVQNAASAGIKEAVLTGVHLGSYGRELGAGQRSDLKDLVAAVLQDTEIARLRLSSLEPWELADGFFDLWARWPQRLCPHLHLPLQAGTDRQLRRMARRCTVDSFRQLVNDGRAAVPDLIVTTDLIVGFPGETDEDFAMGLAVVEELRFAHAHIFPFSPRAGTAAAKFRDQVATEVKKTRSQQMHALVERTGFGERARFLGEVRPVLWESASDELSDGSGRLWSGFTDNYLRVMAAAAQGVDLHNRITSVHLDELHGDTLFGTILPDAGAPASGPMLRYKNGTEGWAIT